MTQPVSPIGHNVFHVHDTTCFMYRKQPATLHIVVSALADGHLQ